MVKFILNKANTPTSSKCKNKDTSTEIYCGEIQKLKKIKPEILPNIKQSNDNKN